MNDKTPNEELAENLERVYCDLQEAHTSLTDLGKTGTASFIDTAMTQILKVVKELGGNANPNCSK